MSIYAIGDLQGCLTPLQSLLDQINFDPTKDQLWFAGDLVNRGPQSLPTLQFIMQLGDRARVVLGNHDLHFLAVAAGYAKHSEDDHLDALLNDAHLSEYTDWIRKQALLHHDPDTGFTMIHAGLAPQWDLLQAQACAAELEQVLGICHLQIADGSTAHQ